MDLSLPARSRVCIRATKVSLDGRQPPLIGRIEVQLWGTPAVVVHLKRRVIHFRASTIATAATAAPTITTEAGMNVVAIAEWASSAVLESVQNSQVLASSSKALHTSTADT